MVIMFLYHPNLTSSRDTIILRKVISKKNISILKIMMFLVVGIDPSCINIHTIITQNIKDNGPNCLFSRQNFSVVSCS